MSKILLVGQDFRLLATRAAVLEKTHASVVCCNMMEALTILDSESFDVVVLCHSLSEAQVSEVADAVHRRWPRTRVLMVVSDVSQERHYRGVEFDATSSAEPKRLIRRTSELLEGVAYQHSEERPGGQRPIAP